MFRYIEHPADVNIESPGYPIIAIYAASIGQVGIVNELLARGYRHNLTELKQIL